MQGASLSALFYTKEQDFGLGVQPSARPPFSDGFPTGTGG